MGPEGEARIAEFFVESVEVGKIGEIWNDNGLIVVNNL